MATLDLKYAHYLVSIEKQSRKFLRFLYRSDLFEFTYLPFDLNVAPYVLTKLLKPVAACLTDNGLASVFHLDDILIINKSYGSCVCNVQRSRWLFQERRIRCGATLRWFWSGYWEGVYQERSSG